MNRDRPKGRSEEEIKASIRLSETERLARALKLGLPANTSWRTIHARKEKLKKKLGLPPTATWKEVCERLP